MRKITQKIAKKQKISPRSRPAFGCQPALKSNSYLLVDPLLLHVFVLLSFLFLIYFVPLMMEKVVLASDEKLILTIGRTTQNIFVKIKT